MCDFITHKKQLIMDNEFMKEVDNANSETVMLDELLALTVETKRLEAELKIKKERLESVRASLLDFMQRNKFVKRETEKMIVTVKDAYESRSVDSDLLKKDGIYDKYCKTKTVAASLVVKIKG